MLKQITIIAVIALFSLVAAFEAKSIISMATTQNISFSNDSYFLGGQPPSYYLNTNTAFSSEISGTYNTIDVLDNTSKPYCGNITGAASNLCTLIDTYNTTAEMINAVNDTSLIYGFKILWENIIGILSYTRDETYNRTEINARGWNITNMTLAYPNLDTDSTNDIKNRTDINITKAIISTLTNCDTLNTTSTGELTCGTDATGTDYDNNSIVRTYNTTWIKLNQNTNSSQQMFDAVDNETFFRKTGGTITGDLNASGQKIITQNITLGAGGKIMPYSDSTTALSIANSSGFDFVTFDSTNKRVGIGVTPTAKLEITSGGNTNPNIQINSAEGRGIRIDKTGGGETLLYLIQNDAYNNAFLEGYGGGETPLLVKIDGNGKLLITTSTEVSGTDGHQIFINDPATTAKGLKIGFDTTGDYGFINPVWEGTAYLDLVLAKVGGEVGIGMIPTVQFELSGSVGQKATGTTWSNPSDRRLKENIMPFTDGLNVITKVNPISYNLNGLGGTTKGTKGISVIAQDILSIAPYTIDTYKAKLYLNDTKETELYRFEASALTFVLVNAVKEQQIEIEELKKRIEALENR